MADTHTTQNDDTLIGAYLEADAWQREISHPDYNAAVFTYLRERAYARVLSITEQFTAETWRALHAHRRATK